MCVCACVRACVRARLCEQLDNLFGGIAGFFTCICEPQSCAPRGQAPEYSEEASNVPPRVDDERFAEMESDEGIQRSFRSYSSVSKNGRAIERGNFPSFCRHFFYRVDPSYALTTGGRPACALFRTHAAGACAYGLFARARTAANWRCAAFSWPCAVEWHLLAAR